MAFKQTDLDVGRSYSLKRNAHFAAMNILQPPPQSRIVFQVRFRIYPIVVVEKLVDEQMRPLIMLRDRGFHLFGCCD